MQKNWTFDNEQIAAEVSPCIWMYPTYGLQLAVRIISTGQTEYLHIKKPFAEATEADALDMLSNIFFASCACGNLRFDTAAMHLKSNRGDQCEKCFLARLNADYERDRAAEEKKVKRYDARMKSKGFCYKVHAWIHPKGGGDDYVIDYYFANRPTDAEIQKELAKKSSVTTDYTISNL